MGKVESALTFRLVGGAACALFWLGCVGRPDAAVTEQAVTYNGDTRIEYFEASATQQMWADSTAIMTYGFGTSSLQSQGSLGAVARLCSTERFFEEPSVGSCSGTLVGPRHILTAGHCVRSRGCAGTRWAFGLRYSAAGRLNMPETSEIYSCSRVVARTSNNQLDYAVVELDRDVVGHTPRPLRASTVVQRENVTLIGYPDGIPVKIDPDGHVVSIDTNQYFRATIDAFSGNSGSGVFDEMGRVVGVLTQGANDYVPNGGCNVVNNIPCTGNCAEGEVVMRTDAIAADACRQGVTIWDPTCMAVMPRTNPTATTTNTTASPAPMTKLGGGGCAVHTYGTKSRSYDLALFGLGLAIALAGLRKSTRR